MAYNLPGQFAALFGDALFVYFTYLSNSWLTGQRAPNTMDTFDRLNLTRFYPTVVLATYLQISNSVALLRTTTSLNTNAGRSHR